MLHIGELRDTWGDPVAVEADLANHAVEFSVDTGGEMAFIDLSPEAAEEFATYLQDAATAAREARDKEEC